MQARQDEQLQIIEEGIAAAWSAFEGNHDDMIRRVVRTIKGSVCLSERDLERLMPKINERLFFLVTNMKEAFGLYKADFKTRLGIMMRVEIKKLVDAKVSELGLGGKEQDFEEYELNESITEIGRIDRTLAQ